MHKPLEIVGLGLYAINRLGVTDAGKQREVLAFALTRTVARTYAALETEKVRLREGELACSIEIVNLLRSKWQRRKYHGHYIPDTNDFDSSRIQLTKPLPVPPVWAQLNDRDRWTSITFLRRVQVCRDYGASDPQALARVKWDELPLLSRERLAALLAEVKL